MGGRNPSSSSRKTKSPSFFKALVGSFASKLRIPPAFLKHFQGKLPERSILGSPTGRSWTVKMQKVDNGLFFGDGWESFVKDHCLEFGDFLVFRYKGNSRFNVKIYDRTACEKDIVASKRKNDEPVVHPLKKEQESDVIKEKLAESSHSIKTETEIKCFTVACRPYTTSFMMLSRKVVEENGFIYKQRLQLYDPNGKLWTVKLSHLKDGRVAIRGWGELWK